MRKTKVYVSISLHMYMFTAGLYNLIIGLLNYKLNYVSISLSVYMFTAGLYKLIIGLPNLKLNYMYPYLCLCICLLQDFIT